MRDENGRKQLVYLQHKKKPHNEMRPGNGYLLAAAAAIAVATPPTTADGVIGFFFWFFFRMRPSHMA